MMRLRPPRRLRLPRPGDDTGSIPMAMMLIVVGMGLSTVLTPIVVDQLHGTSTTAATGRALHAAQTGLDIAQGHIRSARDTATKVGSADAGVLASLPCGPFEGKLSAEGNARYKVFVYYLRADPQQKTPDWILANALPCTSSPEVVPSFAALHSFGTDRPTGGSVETLPREDRRELWGTHIFRTSNANIPGGLIRPGTAGTQDLCFAAPSETPATGSFVTMELCSPGNNRQKFEYTTDLNIRLSATVTAASAGMCLDAGSSPSVSNAFITFRPCGESPTLPQQQWSLTDGSNLRDTNALGTGQGGMCLQIVTTNTVGSRIRVNAAGCSGGATGTFSMDAQVGAGAAMRPNSGQIVNFKQFGRCLDITNFTLTYAYDIGWPCKQDPNPSAVGWNQRWTYPKPPAPTPTLFGEAIQATGYIRSAEASGTQCLRSPKAIGTGRYVNLGVCSAVDTAFQWTVFGDTGKYETMYRVQDSTPVAAGGPYCLSLTDPDVPSPDLYGSGFRVSKTIVEKCSSSTMQKWNAPPYITEQARLKDLKEE
jgi:hypothetical protein